MTGGAPLQRGHIFVFQDSGRTFWASLKVIASGVEAIASACLPLRLNINMEESAAAS